jgi:hypothetical protein
MAYADLTAEQKASLDAWMALFRATCGELARAMNHCDVVNIEYNGAAGTVMATLENTDTIPVQGGLTGAEVMTKAEVMTVVSYLQGVIGYNTSAHRGNIAKACGEANLIG